MGKAPELAAPYDADNEVDENAKYIVTPPVSDDWRDEDEDPAPAPEVNVDAATKDPGKVRLGEGAPVF